MTAGAAASPPTAMNVCYRSENLVVGEIRPFAGRSVVVSFCPREDLPGLDRAGFGEAFLVKNGIDAVHILCRDNRWYQYDDIAAALAVAAAKTAGYANRVAVGWSMGGYAAINFSDRLGVNRVIAISPQFSPDPALVPFETRWLDERRDLVFRHDRIAALPRRGAEICVVYDDRHELDRAHVALIRQAIDIVELPVSDSGHPAGARLASAGVLAGTIAGLIEGTLDRKAFAELVSRIAAENVAPAVPSPRAWARFARRGAG